MRRPAVAPERTHRCLDDVLALQLHRVEVARRHHPVGELRAVSAQPPADVFLGVD